MIQHLARLLLPGRRREPRNPSLDGLLAEVDSHLANVDALITPAPESLPRTPFDADLPAEELSLANVTARQRLQVARVALPLMADRRRGARLYGDRFRPTKSEASPAFIAALEALARRLGAKDVGYVTVPRTAIFRDKGIPAEHAIIFSVEMDRAPLDGAPSFACQLEVMRGYRRMARIAWKLARFLGRHGYAAYPGTALGGLADYPHLAELAGMGAIGYHGLLIAPDEGARLRLNTLYTNITNLPTPARLGQRNEHLWVRDFCAMCRKCVRDCPVDAIFATPRARGDGGMQTIDHAACRDYFARHPSCAICLAICPFSRAGYARIQAHFKGNSAGPSLDIPVRAAPPMVAEAPPPLWALCESLDWSRWPGVGDPAATGRAA